MNQLQSTDMERGAGTASLAIADNAVLSSHKAVLFRAIFENSIMTHVQSAWINVFLQDYFHHG